MNPPQSAPFVPGQPTNLFYRGASMLGTFKPGDKLIIEKVPFARIKRGDVIIFRGTDEDHSDFLVHRVAAVTADGLVTRGDNCHACDNDPIAETSLIGRVSQRDRRGRVGRVANDGMGQMRAVLLHGRLKAARWLRFVVRKPYIALRTTGFIARMWHPTVELVHFETPDGPMVKYMHNGKTVAISRGKKKFCLVKRPFDLYFFTFSRLTQDFPTSILAFPNENHDDAEKRSL